MITVIACMAAAWQWQRSSYHDQKVINATAQLLQPLHLNAVAASEGYATVTGTWLTDSTTFVSPRMMDGRMGALAIAVLSYIDGEGKKQHIAVQRGWAAHSQPTLAPTIAPLVKTSISLQGELASTLPRAYALKSLPIESLGIWQNYDAAAYARILKITLQPHVLILLPDSLDSESQLLRRVPAQQAIDALKQKANSNRGYALQWLGLAIVGLIGLAWMWRTRSRI